MSPLRKAALFASLVPALAGGLAAAPAAQADVVDYAAAMDYGFGTLNSTADYLLDRTKSRAEWNLGPATNGDDGVIVTKFFIPNAEAAGGLLRGDNRTFNNAPTSPSARAVLVWDVRSGRVSLVATPSELRLPVSKTYRALRVDKVSTPGQVTSSGEVAPWRWTNLAYARRTSEGGLQAKISLLNSVTNLTGVGAWSVDFTATITRRPAGGYDFRLLGNGYPAVESYYYPRVAPGRHTLFLRRVDPDKLRGIGPSEVDAGGGVGAIDRASWFDCSSTPGGGSFCDNLVDGPVFSPHWIVATPDDYSTSLSSSAG